MTTDVLAGLDFRASIRDAQKGLLLKPIIHNYLFDAAFPDFDMKFRNHRMEREPDNWFHPSTHPLWPAPALFHYLTHPKRLRAEKKEYMGTLAVTVGTAMHGFMEVCLEDAGVRPKALNTCTVCPPKAKCGEPGVIDTETGSRGHMDGVLDLSSLSTPSEEYDQPVLEFKSMNPTKLGGISDLDLDAYRAKCPVYYAQNQEYMRMSGRRMTIVFIMSVSYPFAMSEIHVPYDPTFAAGIRDKYLQVRQAVADQEVPGGCCGKVKTCVAGGICATKEKPVALPLMNL